MIGRILEGRAGKASDETRLHLTLVRQAGAGSVLHTHSVWGTLLSAANFSAGTLTLVGNAAANNQFSVDLVAGGKIGANVNGVGVAEPISSVHRINVTGGSAYDFIYINAAITVPASSPVSKPR